MGACLSGIDADAEPAVSVDRAGGDRAAVLRVPAVSRLGQLVVAAFADHRPDHRISVERQYRAQSQPGGIAGGGGAPVAGARYLLMPVPAMLLLVSALAATSENAVRPTPAAEASVA